MRLLQEYRDVNDEIAAGYVQMWETIKSSAASTLSSMAIEFANYGKNRENAEKDHQQKLQDIILLEAMVLQVNNMLAGYRNEQ